MAKPFKLKNDHLLVSTEAPGGVYNADQLQKVAALCEDEMIVVRATEDQRLAFTLPESKIEEVKTSLGEVGLGIRHYQDGLHMPVSCIGGSCPHAEQDALACAIDIGKELAAVETSEAFKIGVNGCATCCVPTHTLDISILGESGGHRISIGGKTPQLPELAAFVAEGVPSEELPGLVGKLVQVYKEHAQGEEALQEVMERVGMNPFVAALAPYSQDAADDGDPFAALSDEPGEEDAPEIEAESAKSEDEIDLDDLPEAEEISMEDDSVEAEALAEEEISLEAAANEADLDISADIGEAADIEGDIVLSDDPTDEMPDISPSDQLEGGLDEDVPIMDSDDGELDEIASIDDEVIEEAEEVVGSKEVTLEAAAEEPLQDTDDLEIDDIVSEELDSNDLDDLQLDDSVSLDSIEEVDLDSAEAASDDELDVIEEMDEDAENDLEEKLELSIAEQESLAQLEQDENSDERNQALEMVESSTDDEIELNSYENVDLDSEELDEFDGDADILGSRSNNHFETLSEMNVSGSRVSLSFSSGASIGFDAGRLEEMGGSRTFTIDGQDITVQQQGGDIKISVDGLEINLPQKNAA